MRALRGPAVALVLAIAVLAAALAQSGFPVPPLARVIDQAAVLSPTAREQLARLLAEHERRNSNQIVVVTLRSLLGYDIAEVGLQLGRAWRLGTREHSNGALLIVVPSERKLRIEVGYGLEGNVPDARANQIIQTEIVPRLRSGDVEGGIVKGAMALVAAAEGAYQPAPAGRGEPIWMLYAIGVLIVVAVVANIYLTSGRPRGPSARGPWGMNRHPYGYRRGGWGSGPIVILPPSGGGWSGGSGSSGGGSGGGFSGGGGSFGGGGASGSW